MSNLTVSGIYGTYTYATSDVSKYLNNAQLTRQDLQNAFSDFSITPTGNASYDLQKLNKAVYEEYSTQVKEQMKNQNEEQAVPWAGICKQIGVPVTGDKDTDYAAFQEAIKLLSQSAYDGQAQTYFAGLKTEAQSVFGQKLDLQNNPTQSYTKYIQNYNW